MKKNICMLLIFCMTIAMLPINVLSEADHCFMAIEAESGINDMTLPGAFQMVREEEASGGKAMKQYSYEPVSYTHLRMCLTIYISFHTGQLPYRR